MIDSPELPPRPAPPRRLGDSVAAWLAWFGLGRLIVSAVCVVVVAVGVAWLVRAPAPATEAGLPFSSGGSVASTLPPPSTTLPPPPATSAPSPAPTRLVVHVAGAVVAPGVFEFDPGERVHDALVAAGGPRVDGDLDGLNLAVPLADGQRVYVPVVGEVDPASVPSNAPAVPAADAPVEAAAGPVDLNTATADQLETLPGIGPATAAAIVDDRDQHGPFASVGDLERVPGIGPAKLAAVADLVTV